MTMSICTMLAEARVTDHILRHTCSCHCISAKESFFIPLLVCCTKKGHKLDVLV